MGSVVVSVDAELGWGFHDLANPPTARVENARSGWRTLADLCERYDVPATWAVVGHLLLEDCDGRHADHPLGAAWFGRERGSWANRPDLRFGPSLVARLVESGLDHDVGCHTFSHVQFDDCSRSVAAAELDRFQALAAEWGIDASSVVFPRNAVGHRDLLADRGFTCYRGARPTPTLAGKLLRARGLTPVELASPSVDEHGLVDVPPSLFLFGFEGHVRRLSRPLVGDPVVVYARRGIDRAAETDGVFHMWLHPNNLVGEAQVDRVERVFAHLDDRRDAVDIETMATVAGRTRAASAVAPSSDA
jgi:peptidoglycan/xylan/chitin deacetylase (PgdA/CDA1 family)